MVFSSLNGSETTSSEFLASFNEFPFEKYEHVFCPEFNMGAMENPGLITLNEYYLFENST